MNKCWNTQTQVFGFRNKFSKLQKLKFHIKQVNYYLRYCYLQTCILAREASYHRLESLQECCGQSWHGGWVWEEGEIQWLLSLCLLLWYVSYTLLFLNLQFAALTVPEPVDTQTAKIDSQEQEAVSLSSYFSESFSVLWLKRAHQRYSFSFKYTYKW